MRAVLQNLVGVPQTLIDKFRNFLISSNYFVTSRPEYQFGHRPHNHLLKTFFYKCRVMFAPCVAIQTLKTIVFLFFASPNHAREGNDGLKRSILPVSPLKTTIVFVAAPDKDASRDPQLNIGRHFASPKKTR